MQTFLAASVRCADPRRRWASDPANIADFAALAELAFGRCALAASPLCARSRSYDLTSNVRGNVRGIPARRDGTPGMALPLEITAHPEPEASP